ncbi:patatin-like phospholipase family protein [Nibrella saemangeumensis]|uniref:Patatin-like phospholipase family protein n=1 Tax=Nibrella saemangeumensis TaxID=1084526 RepID=A0ABP8MLJ5_9BACT
MPDQAPDQTPTFYLGLCMAGAISAGAYTAGVMDYLIEALDRWEQARNSPDPAIRQSVPQHKVVINVITGASAGGIAAAIALAALQRKIEHVTNGQYKNFTGNNKLYEAWINLTANEMLPELLKTSDIDTDGGASLLNSNFVDKIADEILNLGAGEKVVRPYISDDLELCLSLSNLTGFTTEIVFSNILADSQKSLAAQADNQNAPRYLARTHRDFGHFRIGKTYQNDGRIPLWFEESGQTGIDTLRDCAKATGAFPIGLRWRKVVRPVRYINDNPLINPYVDWNNGKPRIVKQLLSDDPATPAAGVDRNGNYSSLNVDGGMLNNEPFDTTDKLLQMRGVDLRSGAGQTPGTVLMIDPFPSVPGKDPAVPNRNIPLREIVEELYKTMRSELLVKADVLQKAASANNYCQFLIAPSRDDRSNPSRKIFGAAAIACGSLGGFGGFLTRKFREHDFQLGRHNCQSFLRKHFLIPLDADNPIFAHGYQHLQHTGPGTYSKQASGDSSPRTFVPIIPDVDPQGRLNQDQEPEPSWPALTYPEIEDLLIKNSNEIESRLKKLTLANFKLGFFKRLLVSWFSTKVSEDSHSQITAQLKAHDLVRE